MGAWRIKTKGNEGKLLVCSCCGKSQDEVEGLMGNPGAHVCNGCVDIFLKAIVIEKNSVFTAKSREATESKGKNKDDDKLLLCSFCGKTQQEVRKLIAGPSVYICDECVDLCSNIIKDET